MENNNVSEDGTIFLDDCMYAYFWNIKFINNLALTKGGKGGGLILTENSFIYLNNCTFISNAAY